MKHEGVDLEKVIGRRVRRLRESRGLSQAQLGQMAGFGEARQSTMAKLEAGQRPLRVNEVVALAEALQVPKEVLLEETAEQERSRAAAAVAAASTALQYALVEEREAETGLDQQRRLVERRRDELRAAEERLHYFRIEDEVKEAQQRWRDEQGDDVGEHPEAT